MKRIRYAGGSMITGGVVADALLEYAKALSGIRPNVCVDVPVLETDGSVVIHTLLMGPASRFDVEDLAAAEEFATISEEDERTMFPGPTLPAIGVVESAESLANSKEDTAQFNTAVTEIDKIL